ncbi:hypothetical protein K3495_g204 [Podosphaera aphanis]|nr:hypothetical protein K3495_g204 [Podosphaera aphanis]
MPVSKASGSNSNQSDTTRKREHNQGNQDRKYTLEQKAEVIRIRRCSPHAYYDILGLEKVKSTVTEAEIKKAYRRISLLTHPDKNSYENADEAFKMVGKAFGVLQDKEKRAQYDRYGGDVESRFGRQQGGSRTEKSSNGGNMWEQELTPDEVFRRFFGAGGGGGVFGGGAFRGFEGPPGLFFNMGGGPGIRVQQFGGQMPRRRPRDPNAREETTTQSLMGLLPLLMVLLLPFLSSLLGSGSASAAEPSMRFDSAAPPHTLHRHTNRLNVDYFINPHDVQSYTPSQFHALDRRAEINYINRLNLECQQEDLARQNMINQAHGWFFPDTEKMKKAQQMPRPACRKLESLGQY